MPIQAGRPLVFTSLALVESFTLHLFVPYFQSLPFYSVFVRLFAVNLVLSILWGHVIDAFFLSPLRHLPKAEPWSTSDIALMGQPRGLRLLKWIKTVPNDGLIFSRSIDGTDTLLATSPRAFSEILVQNSYDYEKPEDPRRFLARILGWGLIASEGEQHKVQRKVVSPAFHLKNIRELYGLMWEKSLLLTDLLAKGLIQQRSHGHFSPAGTGHEVTGNVDMTDWASRLTLDIIGPAAMGRNFQTLQHPDDATLNDYIQLFSPTFWRVLYTVMCTASPAWVSENWPTNITRLMNEAIERIRQTCAEIVREKKEVLAQEKAEGRQTHDILGTMLRGGEISDDACVDQMLTFLGAGHETTANALNWTCYVLSKHPHSQDRLRAELRQAIPNIGSHVTGAALEALPYLHGVCHEVLRLYPTVPQTIREVKKETTLVGTKLPVGTWVILSPYATNRDPKLWGPDAEVFKPERWIDMDEKTGSPRPNNNGGADSNYAMMTFLHGPRSCIGQGFARAELRCAVAAMVSKFGIALQEPNKELTSIGAITAKPKGGMKLVLTLLNDWGG